MSVQYVQANTQQRAAAVEEQGSRAAGKALYEYESTEYIWDSAGSDFKAREEKEASEGVRKASKVR